MVVPYQGNDVQLTSLIIDQPMTADFSTISFDMQFFDMLSIQAVWVGANKTTAKIIPQSSIDNINWCNLVSESDAKRVDAAAGCQMYGFDIYPHPRFRVFFEKKTNSTGTISIHVFAKRQRVPK